MIKSALVSLMSATVFMSPFATIGTMDDVQRKEDMALVLAAIDNYQQYVNRLYPGYNHAIQCELGAVPAFTAIPECDTDSSGRGVGNGGFEGAVQLGTPADADNYDCTSLLIPYFIKSIPIDPNPKYDASNTGYYICQDTSKFKAKVYIISAGVEGYGREYKCEMPGTTEPALCSYHKM